MFPCRKQVKLTKKKLFWRFLKVFGEKITKKTNKKRRKATGTILRQKVNKLTISLKFRDQNYIRIIVRNEPELKISMSV